MRWSAFTKCIREGCDGDIEFWLEEVIEIHGSAKPRYRFTCTECDLQGPWELFARQRKYRGSDKRGTRVSGGERTSRFTRAEETFEYGGDDF